MSLYFLESVPLGCTLCNPRGGQIVTPPNISRGNLLTFMRKPKLTLWTGLFIRKHFLVMHGNLHPYNSYALCLVLELKSKNNRQHFRLWSSPREAKDQNFG